MLITFYDLEKCDFVKPQADMVKYNSQWYSRGRLNLSMQYNP